MINALDNINANKYATVIQLKDIFCKDDICEYIDDKRNLFYSDGNHLAYAGALLVVEEIMKYINLSK